MPHESPCADAMPHESPAPRERQLYRSTQDMLKEVCRKKGLTYDDFVADLKKKGQWRVEVY